MEIQDHLTKRNSEHPMVRLQLLVSPDGGQTYAREITIPEAVEAEMSYTAHRKPPLTLTNAESGAPCNFDSICSGDHGAPGIAAVSC
jgi:hypothetical protein